MTDSPGRGSDAPTPPTSTHNPFAGLLDKAHKAAGTLEDAVQSGAHAASVKASEIYHDPKVQAGVNEAGAAATRMGRGAAAQAGGEMQSTAAAARRGDVRTVVENVAGGPHLIVGKIIATQVVGEGMRHLSPEEQRKLESSPVGHAVVNAAVRGQIPTSPSSLARIAEGEARRTVVNAGREAVLTTATEGQNRPAYRPEQAVVPARTAASEAPPTRTGFTNVRQALSWIPALTTTASTEQTKH